VELFFFLIPILCVFLPEWCVGNVELIRLLVATVDSAQLYMLTSRLSLWEFTLFGDSLVKVIEHSLLWETFEQVCLWQLIVAELSRGGSCNSTVEETAKHLLNNVVDPLAHQEALWGLLCLLKDLPPTISILEMVLSLNISLQRFTASLLLHWFPRFNALIPLFICQALDACNSLPRGIIMMKHLIFWLTLQCRPPCRNVMESSRGISEEHIAQIRNALLRMIERCQYFRPNEVQPSLEELSTSFRI